MRILKLIYQYWMKFARVLGRIQTAIILFLIYFLCLGPISLISFIFRRDFLDKRFVDKPTFWRARPEELPTLESSKRQF